MSVYVIREHNKYEEIVKRELDEKTNKKLADIIEKTKIAQKEQWEKLKPKQTDEEKKELKERAHQLVQAMLLSWGESSELQIEFDVDYTLEKYGDELGRVVSCNLLNRGFGCDATCYKQKQTFVIEFDAWDSLFTMSKLEANNDLPIVKNKMIKLLEKRQQERQLIEDATHDILKEWTLNGQNNVKNKLWTNSVCNAICFNINEKRDSLWCHYDKKTKEFIIEVQ